MFCNPRVDNSHTTLEAVVEVTLASATSKNLSLDDHVIALCSIELATVPPVLLVYTKRTNGLCYRLGLLSAVGNIALGDADAILATNQSLYYFSLLLLDEHTESRSCAERHSWMERLRRCWKAACLIGALWGIGVSCNPLFLHAGMDIRMRP